MARAAFRIRIKPEKVDDYVEAHRGVFPELLAAFIDVGIRNYTIFLDGSTAFGCFEADDLTAADATLAGLDVNRRWQETMAPLIEESIAGVGPGYLPEIFRFDG